MNILLAKTKGRNGEIHKVLTQDDGLFTIPNLSDVHNYDPSDTLADDEWFVIRDFSNGSYKNELIAAEINSIDHTQIQKEHFSKLDYFCFVQGEYLIFQKVTRSQLMEKKWINISGDPTICKKPILILNPYIDAIYCTQKDILYFKDVAKLKVMFKGIEELYREATQEEVDEFLSDNLFNLTENYTGSSVGVQNRKRIALAMDTINSLDEEDRGQLLSYIQDYCEEIEINDGCISISSEEQLKMVLYGIEQRYYTTRVGKERRLASGVRKLGNAS